MRRALGLSLVLMALAGCQCGKSEKELPDAGPTPTPTPTPQPGTLAFAEWCPNVERGFRSGLLQGQQECGQTEIRDDELERLGFMFGQPVYPLVLFAGNCSTGPLQEMNAKFAASIAAGRMAYDGQKAFDCRQLGRQDAGSVTALQDSDGRLIEPCRSVLSGQVAAGGSCDYHEECAGEHYCRPAAHGSCGGTCQPRLGAGAPCNPDRDLCVVGATCNNEAGSHTCVAPGGPGATCTSDDDCREELTCSAGQCATRAAAGGPCTDIGEQGSCQEDLVCVLVGGAGQCRALAQLGQACGDPADGLTGCVDCSRCGGGGVCVAAVVGSACAADDDCPDNSWCQAGSCAIKPREGQPCVIGPDEEPAETAAGNCLYGDTFCRRPSATATAGTCAALPILGAPCGNRHDAADCAQGFCAASGLCTAPLGQGSPCPQGNECDDGLWCAPGAAGTDTCQPLPGPNLPCADGACADGAYCEGATDTCRAEKPVAASCEGNAECQSGLCDAVARVCTSPCNRNYDRGCGGCVDGARDYSMFLFFALVLLPGVAGRRKRTRG